MEENQTQNLTKKQQKELHRQEKLAKQESSINRKKLSRSILWTIMILFVVGTVVGMMALVSKKTPENVFGGTVKAADDSDWIKGAPLKDAKIEIIEYSDFQCPACALYYPMIKQLGQDFKDNASIIYRHFPLSQHLNARPAAQAAQAAGEQGKFWEMHDLIFINQDNWKNLKDSTEFFLELAKTLGLDIEKFKTDYNSGESKDKIQKDFASGVAAGINGTPSFYINGNKIENPRNYDEFKRIVKQAIDANP